MYRKTLITHLTTGQNINDIYTMPDIVKRNHHGIWGWTRSSKNIDDMFNVLPPDNHFCKVSELISVYVFDTASQVGSVGNNIWCNYNYAPNKKYFYDYGTG